MSAIPQEFLNLGKELAALADSYKLRGLSVAIDPGYDSAWRDRINFSWTNGRHGDSTHLFALTSTVDVRVDVRAALSKAGG